MKNKRNLSASIAMALMALPLAFLLWVLGADLVKMYGLMVVPVGVAAFLVISVFVDKFLWRQSAQLEHALVRTLRITDKKFDNRG